MENLYINWRMIFLIICFILVVSRLLKHFCFWIKETKVLQTKMVKPSDFSVQAYLYWIGCGLHAIFWLIVFFIILYARCNL